MVFRVEAYQNRFLSPGQRRVDAILGITALEDVGARLPPDATERNELVVGFIVDKSGSMNGARLDAAKDAVVQALRILDERASFFVVAFDGAAQVVVPPTRATEAARAQAAEAIRVLFAGGGTAMSSALSQARLLFAAFPDAIRYAVFLTDGKNESEPRGSVAAELTRDLGLFECDCWGVGTDWKVGEVQEIARALLGRAQIVPEAAGIAAAFEGALLRARAKTLKDVRLRLWTPLGAELAFVKMVNPTLDDLTSRTEVKGPQLREIFTGAWGAGETRDFHLAVDVDVKAARAAGDEMLVVRPSMVFSTWADTAWHEQEERSPEGRVFASWTADEVLSSRIDRQVAHYTGQGELAAAIQTGLELRERGDVAQATQHLGRAVQLAHGSGAAETSKRLAQVVEVLDAANGTVRLKKQVAKAAAMELELESTTTKRSRRR